MYIIVIIQGQGGWGSDQPGLVKGAPGPWQRGWNEMIFKAPSNQNHSMILSKNKIGRNGINKSGW